MVKGANQRSRRIAEGSPVSMGGEGQGEQGGRVSDSSSPTGDAGNARNILPRGVEQVVADLMRLKDIYLKHWDRVFQRNFLFKKILLRLKIYRILYFNTKF